MSHARYDTIDNTNHSPYGSGNAFYQESSGYIAPMPAKKRSNNLVRIGIPVGVLVIIAIVVGVVVGIKESGSNSSASGAASASNPSAVASEKNAFGRFATATNSEFMMPIYPSTTNTALFTVPTFLATTSSNLAWPKDSFQPSSPSLSNMRPDRPRLIAPAYKWAALPQLIANDPYLSGWNVTIFGNATDYYSLPPVAYHLDGDSGILDNSREIKMRIKAFSYVFRMTNDTKWVDRVWEELVNAAGNGTNSFGPNDDTKWNPTHFLDTAEMTSAFAIAYDWLYDQWPSDKLASIRSTMIQYGLNQGLEALTQTTTNYNGWWAANSTTGNWNCVCNAGLTIGSLAILGDDTTGIASQLLSMTVTDAASTCVNAPSTDGTWAETANYWYFGTTGHAEMTSALMTATGSDWGMLTNNPSFPLTGVYHMYATGPTSLFNYGDHGPNKFSTTANAMIFYAEQFDMPQFSLFQRDQRDAAEPWSMFWYEPTVFGAFWDGQPLDYFFDNELDQWGSMRSSWTDNDALYVAMKAGKNQGHQTHNDLDCGDFVLDALGTRWAGELGSADYLSPGYFSNDTQVSERWMYYRKMTEGQNTVVINKANQNVLAAPTIKYGTTNETQGSSTVYTVPKGSTAYFTADLTSAYFDTTSLKRGIRTINNRKQVLLQTEITTTGTVQWRMHTNATVTPSSDGQSAVLTLDGQTLNMSLLNAPSGATITTTAPVRYSTDVTPPEADQANPGVTVVLIDLPAGTYNLQVLFNPQWAGMPASDFVTPSEVDLDNWSLTSHP